MSVLFSLLFFFLIATTTTAAGAATSSLLSPSAPITTAASLLPSDAVSLLSFKSQADLDNKLLYTLNERYDYCQWQGVKCAQGRVVRVVLQGFGLRGSFAANTLTRLDQLRVLSLQNNSLSGPVPDLSGLSNLKSLFLSHNSFSGSFPPSVLLLHRLVTVDLSFNNFSGSLPAQLNDLDRLNSLMLEMNRFNGTVPALNQSFLVLFNVSGNNLSGPIPVTPTLLKFDTTAFSLNPDLCGEIINKVCGNGTSHAPFFGSGNATSSSPPGPLEQSAQAQGGSTVVISPPSPKNKRKGHIVILGFTIGFVVLITSLLCIFVLAKKQRQQHSKQREYRKKAAETPNEPIPIDTQNINSSVRTSRSEQNSEMEAKTTRMVSVEGMQRVKKSGNLVFCGEEGDMYSLEQLMRASAELLGRGTIGTTYKAVLDNQLIVTVKRLDANKTAITSSGEFEQHMDGVGVLRHPNLVPIRAYFQAKGERLVIYDYQPNGSLFNLIHGSRSTRAKPLHWTSCLKIAEDVAQGLAYIHRESKLVHGNLKSSNVLLGTDFEACLTDYCLAVLADSSSVEDPDSAAYKAPETRKSSRRATSRSDVYSFGVLLFELLTGKHPSQHPYLAPADMLDWVRSVRDDDSKEDDRLGMLTEVASVCRLTSPEQRPVMWQVLKMIQEIKERVMMEENASFGYS